MSDETFELFVTPEEIEVGQAAGCVGLRVALPASIGMLPRVDLIVRLEPDEADRLASTLRAWAASARSGSSPSRRN
jgi:hypothetical protein